MFYNSIVFTGWRGDTRTYKDFGLSPEQKRFIDEVSGSFLVHGTKFGIGDATGVDGYLRVRMESVLLDFEVFRADWNVYGAMAGPIRNRQMLDLIKPELVIAFPLPGVSRGTIGTITEAIDRGIRVQVHPLPKGN